MNSSLQLTGLLGDDEVLAQHPKQRRLGIGIDRDFFP
jgi:hypothetical protein